MDSFRSAGAEEGWQELSPTRLQLIGDLLGLLVAGAYTSDAVPQLPFG